MGRRGRYGGGTVVALMVTPVCGCRFPSLSRFPGAPAVLADCVETEVSFVWLPRLYGSHKAILSRCQAQTTSNCLVVGVSASVLASAMLSSSRAMRWQLRQMRAMRPAPHHRQCSVNATACRARPGNSVSHKSAESGGDASTHAPSISVLPEPCTLLSLQPPPRPLLSNRHGRQSICATSHRGSARKHR